MPGTSDAKAFVVKVQYGGIMDGTTNKFKNNAVKNNFFFILNAFL